jgi:RIP metalloprotease RseP
MDIENILRMIGSVLFMIFFFGFCVFIHELGHFLAAKWRGLHIVAFSLGFRKIWSKKIGGVEYRLGWLPFGGYVDLPQIDATSIAKTEGGVELPPAKPFDRMITAFSGPFFNILFGLLLGTVVWIHGFPQDTPRMHNIVVGEIDKNGPEYKAGLRSDDAIVKLNGEKFYSTWNDFVQKIFFSVGKVSFDVERNGQPHTITFEPCANPNSPPELRKEGIAWPFFAPRIPIVLHPDPGSPAEKAGIKNGDLLLEANGTRFAAPEEFLYMINGFESKPMNLKVSRGNQVVEIKNLVPVVDKDVPEEWKKIYRIGIVYDSSQLPAVISSVFKDSPADKAGIRGGDIIIKVNKVNPTQNYKFNELISGRGLKPFTLTLKRGNQELNVTVQAQHIQNYTIGSSLTIFEYPTPVELLFRTVDMSYKSIRGIAYWFAKKAGLTENGSTIKPRNLSGPIGIATILYRSVYQGSLIIGIYFVTIISFALAIFNLLPLPVLDGGHMLLAGIQMITKRPVPEMILKPITVMFISLLILLMVYVTYYDIVRMLPNSDGKPAPRQNSFRGKNGLKTSLQQQEAPSAATAPGASQDKANAGETNNKTGTGR